MCLHCSVRTFINECSRTLTPLSSHYSSFSLPATTATRVEQAALFNNADSGFNVLVATDAIGMGLNL